MSFEGINDPSLHTLMINPLKTRDAFGGDMV